jgi:Nif-specific regulatory protein
MAKPGPKTDTDQDRLVISEAAQLLSRSVAPEVSIRSVLRLVSELVGLNRGRVLLRRDADDHLSIQYSYGLRREEREKGIYAPSEGVTGKVMSTGQVCVVQDIDQEPGFLFRAVPRQTLPPETVCFIALPIFNDDEPIGVLGFHRLRDRPRSFQDDISLGRVLASLIGQTIRIDTLIRERTGHLEAQNEALRSALARSDLGEGLLGESAAFEQTRDEAIRIASTDATVLLSGETGTGKEKFARLIHHHSQRKRGPLVSVNCAAIPEHLLESEIFGHERGAFTGADRTRPGMAEAADGGSLFLDEIGDMPLDLQSKVLRLLQEHKVQRVGGTKEIPVDIRVITATHQNLQQAVNESRFRADLYYRLNVIPIEIPPLRRRSDDIRPLTRYFLARFNERYGRSVSLEPGIIQRLESFHWPGNVRQLENVIERAVLRTATDRVRATDIERILQYESGVVMDQDRLPTQSPPADPSPGGPASSPRPYRRVDAIDEKTLRDALEKARGNKTQAAYNLGLTPRQFQYRMKKRGLA